MAKVLIVALCFLASVIAGSADRSPQRIIGGQNTLITESPFQASIRSNSVHICGGAIIQDNIILTVAHCVSGKRISALSVVVGTNTLNAGGDIYRVSKIIEHPDYNTITRSNDVAVLKLTRSLRLSQLVDTIPLSPVNPICAETLTLIGWGSRDWSSSSLSNTLQKATVQNLDVQTCKNWGLNIHRGNICTSASSSAKACNKDDGSLVINSSGQLVGVTSRISCANNLPDVHMSVPFYSDWITERTYE